MFQFHLPINMNWITTTFGMRGYFAVMMTDRDGFPEPVLTGIGSYKTIDGAQEEAKSWAEAEEMELR